MQLDSNAPIKGPLAEFSQAAKKAPKETGKSFAALFDQTKSTKTPEAFDSQPTKNFSAGPSLSTLPSAKPEVKPEVKPETTPAKTIEQSTEDHLAMIKFRLKTGYYQSPQMDDVLTEKLNGYFDDLT